MGGNEAGFERKIEKERDTEKNIERDRKTERQA